MRVEVRWVDSHVIGRWVEPGDVKDIKAARCRSVGYLVEESDDAIVIAQSIGDGEDGAEEFGQPIVIPRAALLGGPLTLGVTPPQVGQ